MIVQFEFPQIMKMVLMESFEVEDTCTLMQLKQKVFDAAWAAFQKIIPDTPIHGSIKGVTIKASKIEITSDAMLQQSIKPGAMFTAMFVKHA